MTAAIAFAVAALLAAAWAVVQASRALARAQQARAAASAAQASAEAAARPAPAPAPAPSGDPALRDRLEEVEARLARLQERVQADPSSAAPAPVAADPRRRGLRVFP